MKKLLLFSLLMLLCGSTVFANETTIAKQDIVIENNKAVLSLQKQPLDEKTEQKQDVKKNWFCIVVQINGKKKYIDIEK